MSEKSLISPEVITFCRTLPKYLSFKKGTVSQIWIERIGSLMTTFKGSNILQMSFPYNKTMIIERLNQATMYDLSFFDMDVLEDKTALYILLIILNSEEGIKFIRNAGGDAILLQPKPENRNYYESTYDPDLFPNLTITKHNSGYLEISLPPIQSNKQDVLTTPSVSKHK